MAIEADPATDPGSVVFFDTDGNFLVQVTVGSLPDMVTFMPNGLYLLVANDGEPNDDYTADPEGSVSIIRLPNCIERLSQRHVRTADFTRFNHRPLDPSIRIFGPGATVAQDDENDFDSRSDAKGPEPEGITLGEVNGRTYAFIGLERIGGVMVYDVTPPRGGLSFFL